MSKPIFDKKNILIVSVAGPAPYYLIVPY